MKITRNNYFEVIDKFGVKNLPKELKEGHSYIEQATENNSDWGMYNEIGNVRKVIDQHFKFIEEFFSKKDSKAHSEKIKPVIKKAKERAESKPNSTHNKAARFVRNLSEEVKYIKRFVGLHKKKRTANAILNFLKALQKSITHKIISKESPFVKEIEYIQNELIKIYHTIEKKRTKEGITEIPDDVLSKFMGIAGGESVYPSIGFIKRFIGIQGKEIEVAKRENFLSQLERAVKSKKILSDDPFSDRIKKIYTYLKQQYKTGRKISIEKSELNGLECICNNCDKELGKIYDTKGKELRKCKSGKYSDASKGACSYNRGLGKIYDTKGKPLRKCKTGKYSDAGKGACSYNKGLSGLGDAMTAQQIANMQFELLPFNGIWKQLLGQPEKNFSLMVHGEPGAGKSTFLIRFAKYLTGLGSVLYVASEEYGSVTLKNLVTTYLNPVPANLVFVPNLDTTNPGDFDFVIFDSINDAGLKLDSYKQLKSESPETAFILVLQHTKDGQYKGGKEWEHEAQIVAGIQEGIIQVYKNRYGEKGNWNFFES